MFAIAVLMLGRQTWQSTEGDLHQSLQMYNTHITVKGDLIHILQILDCDESLGLSSLEFRLGIKKLVSIILI